jgi:2-methylcitrate dehydratase PrpD
MSMAGNAGAETGTVAERLARRIHAFGPGDLTAKARDRALIGIIDTVAVTLAGARENCVATLRKVPGIGEPAGPATLVGLGARASVLDAALINGTAAHALDYDDFSAVFGGHQSVPLVPGLLALAEAEKLDGRAVLTAYAVGVETEIRLARAVHFHHYDKGWHPTATLGAIGAAAAAAHLLRLGPERIATALALAVSQAAGVKANFGTMTKPLHVGLCARAGVMAALLARAGFTASPAAFEHPQGFFEVFNGAGTYDPERIFANWADPLELEDDGIVVKAYPCCGSTHASIKAALELRRSAGLKSEAIASIEIFPHARRLRHTDKARPVTPLEAKFSVQYVVVRALLDGAVRMKHFEPGAATEPEVVRMLEHTTAAAHPDMAEDAINQWAAEVVVHTTDGRRLSHRIDDLTAGGGAVPTSPAGMWDKFIDCAELSLPSDAVAALFERLETFESVKDMTLLGRMLAGQAEPQAAPTRVQAGRYQAGDPTPETSWVP